MSVSVVPFRRLRPFVVLMKSSWNIGCKVCLPSVLATIKNGEFAVVNDESVLFVSHYRASTNVSSREIGD